MVERSVYIASGLENVAAVRVLQDFMKAIGWSISYDWTLHGSVQEGGEDRIREVAQAELRGVWESDLVIVALPGGRGTHVEMGIAIALGIPIIVYDPLGFEMQSGRTCAFYRLPEVSVAKNIADLETEVRRIEYAPRV